MRDSDPPEGFRQTEYLLETLATFRQCGEWSRLGYRERRFAELKLTFVGPERSLHPVESRCGAVIVGLGCLLPPLSSGGAQGPLP